jgi:nicotinamidase/pyrazinamidase
MCPSGTNQTTLVVKNQSLLKQPPIRPRGNGPATGGLTGVNSTRSNNKSDLTVRTIRILDIGDMQNGFLQKDGSLSIHGADAIIAPAQEFLQAAGNGLFDHTFVVMDTHFAEEYSLSEESRQFPIHCEYGTRDWELAVDVAGLPNIRYLMKNRFGMWADREPSPVRFQDPRRRAAYENLFCFVDDPHLPRESTGRDEYLRAISAGEDRFALDVTLVGVAADYCNRYAMEGWLACGARVTILGDLTRGIQKEWPEVLAEEQYRCHGLDRVRVISSKEFLQERAIPNR